MCLINFSFQQNSQYPFILIANRDEYYKRPAEKLHWWLEEGIGIIAGKDQKDGGTWMGMNKKGEFAALTNYRDLHNIKKQAPSRGIIIKKFLNGEIPSDERMRYLKTQGKFFNGFNIIYGDSNQLFFYSNSNEQHKNIYPGIYGLSNAVLDTPWPKVIKSKKEFIAALDDIDNEDRFFEIFQNKNTAPENELPDTGVSLEWEKKLSSIFINTENYGTRLTTFVRISNKGNVLYREINYAPMHDIKFEFTIEQ